MKKYELKELLSELESMTDDFLTVAIFVSRRIRTYIYSPGIYKFIDERYLNFNNILYACYDEIYFGFGGNERKKFIKWLYIQLQDFLELIEKFRSVEKKVLESMIDYSNGTVDTDSLCINLEKHMEKMETIFEIIKNHKIQEVHDQIQEIIVKVETEETDNKVPAYYEIQKIRNKYEEMNQQVIASSIEKNPEIMEVDIKDIEEYLDDDFYSGIECDIQNWICEITEN